MQAFNQVGSAAPVEWNTFFTIHYWPAFWTVVCLGLIQVTLTYCGSHLAIESLPEHVVHRKRNAYRGMFALLFLLFVFLTLVLAKLNDSNQVRAEAVIQQGRENQDALQKQLQTTLSVAIDSQSQLQRLREAVEAHPPGTERSAMIDSIDHLQKNLEVQTNSMKGADVR